MKDTTNSSKYLQVNKQAWNEKTDVHVKSAFYNVDGFLKGQSSLNPIELELLGDVKGKSILHLQCHFGLDTLSLARLGASVTGIDFSDVAIAEANHLAEKAGLDAKFVESDVYNLPANLKGTFDIIYTSYGTIGWLPDLDKWAAVINHFLKPDGTFIFVEFHPVVWMFDNDFKEIAYNYFNDGEIIETEEGTYADPKASLRQTSITWNHSLAEVIGALHKSDLKVVSFNEYDYSPYPCFNGVTEPEKGKFRIERLGNKIPLVYSICATRNN